MRASYSLLAFIVTLTATGCGSSARKQAELAAMQGRWKVVSADLDQGGAQVYYTITGDKMRVEMIDSVGKKVEMDRFKLRPDPGHSPKRVDLQLIGPGGEDLTTIHRQHSYRPRSPIKKYTIDEHLTPCIYKLEGDTLTICVGNGGERPTAFDLNAFPRSLVLKRVPAAE